MQHSSQVAGKAIGFEWPNGDILFSNLSFSFGPFRYGLVGPNGVGKTTFAEILKGTVKPAQGELQIAHPVTALTQQEDPPTAQSVAEYLVPLWENADAHPELWGPLLQKIDLESLLENLSGGEWMRVRLAKTLSHPSGLLILDEPTNNVDAEGRKRVSDFVRSFQNPLLIISHDRTLLKEVDMIYELSNKGLSLYSGNYVAYQAQKEAERKLQEESLEKARREKKKKEHEHREKVQSQEKRARRGAKLAKTGSLPRIIVGGLQRKAEETTGKVQAREEKRVQKAHVEFQKIYEQTKKENFIKMELPETSLAEGKLVFEVKDLNVRFPGHTRDLWEEPVSFFMRGPRRVALKGANGSGKSTLIKILLNEMDPLTYMTGSVTTGSIFTACLDQNYALLRKNLSVIENVMESSRYDLVETRNRLAQFQFTGEKIHQHIKNLSGGEKLKAALAQILLSDPAPQFLILDEPTNNLDLTSLEVLEQALHLYQGALLVVSHDEVFLKNIHVEEVYVLPESGG